MPHGGLRHVEIAEDVGAEGSLDLIGRDLLDLVLRMLLGGIVDEHVEPAEALDDLVDGGTAEIGIAHIAGDCQA